MPRTLLLAALLALLAAAPLHAQDWEWYGDTPIIDLDRDPTAPRPQPTWAPLGVYDAGNPYEALVIDAAEATFVPFAHDPEDPDRCGPSQIEVRFQVRNEGAEPLRIPEGPALVVLFANDDEHPWETPLPVPVRDYATTPSSERETWNTIRGEAPIAPEVIDAGDYRWVTASVRPPEGAWTPLRVEARLAIRAMTVDFHSAYLFVGREEPVALPLPMDAPDYFVQNGVLRPADGRPLDEARRFEVMVDVGHTGPLVGGPMRIKFRVCREGDDLCSGGLLSDAVSYDDVATGVGPWVTDEMTLGGRSLDPANTYAVVDIEVGCPVHGFDTLLRDANPANNAGRRGPLTVSAGDGGGE